MHALLHSVPPTFSRPLLTHTSTGDSWTFTGKSGSVPCGVTVPVSCILVHTRFCLCPPRVYFPVLCKFWWLYGGVNDDLLSKVLCHTQVYCSQRPCPCSSPLLTCAAAGDTQTQFYLSLGGVSGSWCTRFCCALRESISKSCVSSGSSMVGLMVTSSKRTYAIPTPRAPVPAADHC